MSITAILTIAVVIFIVLIIVGIITYQSPEAIRAENAYKSKLEKEEKERQDLEERKKIADKLSSSNRFKELEVRIFSSPNGSPKRIEWVSSYPNIRVEYDIMNSTSIEENEIPDCCEFMRALAYIHRNEYDFDEYDDKGYGYGVPGKTIKLTKKVQPVQKPSW